MNTPQDELLIQFNVRIPLKQRIDLDRYLAQLKEEPDPESPDTLSGITRQALQEFLDRKKANA